MGYKIDIDSTGRDFFFTPSGNDELSGTSVQNSVELPSRAIDLVNALSPPPSALDPASISAVVTGTYETDSLMLPQSSSVNCRFASLLTFNNSVTILEGSDQQLSTWGALFCFGNNDTVYLIDGKVRHRAVINAMVVGSQIPQGDDCTGVKVTGECDDIFITLTQGELRGKRCVMIDHDAESPTSIIYEINVIEFFDIDQKAFIYNPVNGVETVFNACVIQSGNEGPTTGSMVIECIGGNLVVDGDVMQAETFATVTNDAQLTVRVQVIVGDTVLSNTSAVTFKPVTQMIGNIDVNDTATLFGDIQIFFGNLDTEVGTNAIFNVGFMQGDLNIEGTLFCHINTHTGNITGSGTINGIINGVPFGTYRQKPEEFIVLNASSFLIQAPAGTDTLLQVEFGAAQFGPTDPVQISATGTITINQADQYEVFLIFQYGRTGAAGGTSILMFRVLRNSIQVGLTRYAQLDNPNSAFPVEFTVPFNAVPGDVITFEIWRDSTGFDAGELIPFTPTLIGPNASSSAAISMTRKRLSQPVD